MPDLASALSNAASRGTIVLDGGIGTLLESKGHDLGSELWSARLLLENPDVIRSAHRDYFDAGASIGISSSYQVSFEGLARLGVDAAGTRDLLEKSVDLVVEARSEAGLSESAFVAASVGPYGAMLADGSEYRGDYNRSVRQLREWHRPRLEILAATGADVLAIETIPCLAEVEALLTEVADIGKPAWLSITAAMGRLRSGEALADAFALAADVDQVVAVGVNCSDPLDVATVIAEARRVTAKPVVVYPNSGEQWDAKNRSWMGSAGFPSALVKEWADAGAAIIGGCCRVGPAEIAGIRAVLDPR